MRIQTIERKTSDRDWLCCQNGLQLAHGMSIAGMEFSSDAAECFAFRRQRHTVHRRKPTSPLAENLRKYKESRWVSSYYYCGNVYHCVPEKLIGTLALIISKSIYTIIYPIEFHKLYSTATPRHPKPLLLEYYVVIVALITDLKRFVFHSVIEIPYYSSNTDLIILPMLNKGVLSDL